MSTSALSSTSTLLPPSFAFPAHYSFPPFFTKQIAATTRQSQLQSWSAFIQAYCRHHRIFQLSLIDAVDTELFWNKRLGKRLALADAKEVLSWMCSPEGGERAEWIADRVAGRGKTKDAGASRVWVYWKRPEEWAGLIEGWVDATGQKNTVLTLFEIVESDATRDQGMLMAASSCVSRLGRRDFR